MKKENEQLNAENIQIEKRIVAISKSVNHSAILLTREDIHNLDPAGFKYELEKLITLIEENNRKITDALEGNGGTVFVDPEGEIARLDKRLTRLEYNLSSISSKIRSEINSSEYSGQSDSWLRRYDGQDLDWD